MELVFAYITAGSREEARALARTLVEDRLAACVNIVDGATSVYRWRGAVEETTESLMIVKTSTERFDALVERVRRLHSYETPCVLEVPISRGNPDYLTWLKNALGDGESRTADADQISAG